MTNAEKWGALWNHDVQFGFAVGCFAGVAGLILIMFGLDVFARLVVGGRSQKPVRRVRGDNGGRGL
jgi:hypothetical protein